MAPRLHAPQLLISTLAIALLATRPAHSQDRDCLLTVDRPLPPAWSWSAQCGAQDPDLLQGKSVNLMSGLPQCSASQLSTVVASGKSVPTIPSCRPASAAPWLAIEGVEYHESCFSSLSATDRSRISAWAKRNAGDSSDSCRLDAFGANLSSKRANLPDTPETPAQAISLAFRRMASVNDSCLKSLNPGLWEQMRQAMGKSPRPGSGETLAPRIQCSERASYRCPLAEEKGCETLSNLFLAMGERFRKGEALSPKAGSKDCAKSASPFLAMADVTGQVPGQVVPGAALIDIYESTPRFHESRTAAATLFHEFLHAAGASASKQHNHGIMDLATAAAEADQVYACEAVAFAAAAPAGDGTLLKKLCRLCASSEMRRKCDNSDPRYLENLGCRSHR